MHLKQDGWKTCVIYPKCVFYLFRITLWICLRSVGLSCSFFFIVFYLSKWLGRLLVIMFLTWAFLRLKCSQCVMLFISKILFLNTSSTVTRLLICFCFVIPVFLSIYLLYSFIHDHKEKTLIRFPIDSSLRIKEQMECCVWIQHLNRIMLKD